LNASVILRRLTITVAIVVAVAACSSAPAAVPTPTATPIAATAAPVAATATPIAVTAAPSFAPTTTPTAATAKVSVDLVFTGSKPFVAKGSAGQCGAHGGWFYATEADYPGFGIDFDLSFSTPVNPFIKWNLDAAGHGYSNQFPKSGIALSADKHSVRFDGDLSPSVGTGPEHVSGTITCP
jgi:hypothetical protein